MELLECTLRDGSYAIDFQFTKEFTQDFCGAIEQLGFKYIEVGHGMGIGAGTVHRQAAATDEEYGEAAQNGAKNSKWGMFAQPSFSTIGSIRRLRNIGMSFIRIGIDVENLNLGIEFAQECSEIGLEVYINLMKSHKSSADSLVTSISFFGELRYIDGFYLVDSAGGMLQSSVQEYCEKLRDSLGDTLKLGFHGHDNLGLALPNSILAIRNGFNLIDCTMQGMGRSAGNANAERLISLLSREQIDTSIDPIEVMKVSEKYIRPLLPKAGHSGLDTMAGFVLFHTAYMENLLNLARKERIDPYYLMKEISSQSFEGISLSKIVDKVRLQGHTLTFPIPNDPYHGNEQ